MRSAMRLLLASTLALLGAISPTRGQEAAPVAAPNEETFTAGTAVTIGYAGEEGNLPVCANGDAFLKFCKICKAITEIETVEDGEKCTKATTQMVNSGELHMYKKGTCGTIVKVIPVNGARTIYIVRVEGKKWVTLGDILHLPGTPPRP